MSSFPLLKLPLVVLREVSSCCTPLDILILSNSSKRTANIFHSIISRKRFEMHVVLFIEPKVHIKEGHKEHIFNIPYEQMNRINWKDKNHSMNFVFESISIDNITGIIDHMHHVLNTEMRSIVIDIGHCFGNVPRVVYWLNRRQESVDTLTIIYRRPNDDELVLMLKELKINKHLNISIKSTSHPIKPLNVKLKVDCFWMRGGYSSPWISLDHIANFDCIHIDLTTYSFTSFDMNRYLKAWMSGCNSRMEYLCLNVIRYSGHETLTDGIYVEDNTSSIVRSYTNQILRTPCVFERGTNMRRKDGRSATFQLKPIATDNSETIFLFRMVVWPDVVY
ncbi:hypothetical protein CRE_10316 [Caenorhabditis remanei]|uniref:F-box domain-containing protein n=1 Tax=Caenorhabditis remanei TaxID=31234 RepID=E3M6F7_CAERE|nr:hypothetical protein CRE_10316 [Caenorhabditis remanei]